MIEIHFFNWVWQHFHLPLDRIQTHDQGYSFVSKNEGIVIEIDKALLYMWQDRINLCCEDLISAQS